MITAAYTIKQVEILSSTYTLYLSVIFLSIQNFFQKISPTKLAGNKFLF